MTRSLPTLDIVIVNWNGGGVLHACLASMADADTTGFSIGRVVVVDNASTDASIDGLDAGDPRVTLIRNTTNRGFAAACNQGARNSEADYLLFLNPDTRLHRDSLSTPIAFLDQPDRADVGICGVRMVDASGGTVPSSRRFPTLRGAIGEMTRLGRVWPAVFPPLVLPPPQGDAPVEVDQLIGAFFLIRRSLFDALNGFDEQFFVYYEEVDVSYRAKQRGYRSMYLPAASVFHYGGYSSGQAVAFRTYHALRSRARYARKHWPFADRAALWLATALIEVPARAIRAVLRPAPAGPRAAAR
jgi:N-acetylglucosaminyl-diphospho-decaprenol L-rhamnosyltransferase